MKVVILAGGLGTRIKRFYPNTIKSLIDINGKPFIYHQIDLLKRNGYRDIVICAGNGSKQLRYFLYNSDVSENAEIQISEDGDKLLGTGGAIKNALPLLGESFMVMYGDSYLDFEYSKAEKIFITEDNPYLMTLYHNKNKKERSNVEIKNGLLYSYDKKTPSSLSEYIDYGVNFFKRSCFTEFDEDVFDLSEVQTKYIKSGMASFYITKKIFHEIGSMEGIEELKKELSK